ncbi:unnamed protein product [Cylicocyclus nassatus]|uniref:Uncharacterized protein n=1 Tax=Cylicocyclus nassatus TaxID=53992 RepID=A0AA36HAF9_CYLNA|nr:unnamed protein product [Cylicocyclus nassatus]
MPDTDKNSYDKIASVYAYHGSTAIESTVGPLEGCSYEDGTCNTKEGAAMVWTPEAQEKYRWHDNSTSRA